MFSRYKASVNFLVSLLIHIEIKGLITPHLNLCLSVQKFVGGHVIRLKTVDCLIKLFIANHASGVGGQKNAHYI